MDHPSGISDPVASACERDSYVLDEIQERRRTKPQIEKDHIPHPLCSCTGSHFHPWTTHSLRYIHHLHSIYSDESDPQSDRQINEKETHIKNVSLFFVIQLL